MDKKTKILFIIVASAFIIAAVIKFYLFFIKNEYLIFDHIKCDPYIESCFVYECESEEADCEPEYYKKIQIKGSDYIECATENGTCPRNTCLDTFKDCEITTCSEDVLEDGESCIKLEIEEPVANNSTSTNQEINEEIE